MLAQLQILPIWFEICVRNLAKLTYSTHFVWNIMLYTTVQNFVISGRSILKNIQKITLSCHDDRNVLKIVFTNNFSIYLSLRLLIFYCFVNSLYTFPRLLFKVLKLPLNIKFNRFSFLDSRHKIASTFLHWNIHQTASNHRK